MLQYPTNVSPENTAKPADTTHMKFIFNGDRLSYYNIRATDLETNSNFTIEYKSEDMSGNNGLPYYNGDEVEMAINAQGLTNGHDYVWQVLLAQRDLAGENPLYDIPVCRGAIKRAGSGSPTVLIIDPNLPIYSWGYNGNDGYYYPTTGDNDVVYAGMVIEINGERKFITKYKTELESGTDIQLGHLEIDSAFTTTPDVGTRYSIYANYLISPQYYFMSRATPSLSLELDWWRDAESIRSEMGLRITGTYSQSQSSPIKYYTAKLYAYQGDVDSTSAQLYLLAESDKMFSQKIDYIFQNCLVGLNPWNGEDMTYMNYRVIIELVTQDNVTYAGYASMRVDGINDYAPRTRLYTWLPINLYGCNVCRDDGAVYGRPLFYRTNVDTGETVMLVGQERLYDFKVSTKGNYKYTTVFYDTDTGSFYIKSTKHYEVSTNFDGYYISALIPSSDENHYTIGDTWKFICDIENTTVMQNLDIVSQIGYGRYPTVSSTDLNYMSGTLSAYIGNFDCCEHEYKDDITLVKAWREFISQPHPFLLKSQKGDVWMVNIVESPKTEYQEDYYKIPTRFTFSWAECGNVDDYYFERTSNDGLDIQKINCSAGAPTDKDWYDVTTADDYIYFTDNREAFVVRYIGNSTQPIVPDTLGGWPVTTICSTAFYGLDITGVWLPDTVTNIE